jgi:hypothetical protein
MCILPWVIGSRQRDTVDEIDRIAATQVVSWGERRECGVNGCAEEMNADRANRFPPCTTTFTRKILKT